MIPTLTGYRLPEDPVRKKRPSKKGTAARYAGLTAFQKECLNFLVSYAGYDRTRALNNLSGPQIAEAARLICIRDGIKDWISFVSDWNKKK